MNAQGMEKDIGPRKVHRCNCMRERKKKSLLSPKKAVGTESLKSSM